MCFLIRRRAGVSREELIAHWFANHMPAVIDSQQTQAAAGKLHATRYIASLYGPSAHRAEPWDGMAQLWFDRALPMPAEPHGTTPADSFQERVEPYLPWATTEYVIIDGSDQLPVEPLTLNDPFPTTRSGFHKVSFLVKAKPGADLAALHRHWLDVHAPNVASVMTGAGGFRYVVSLSLDPALAPFAGLAELYFHHEAGWAEFRNTIGPDGMDTWTDAAGTLVLRSGTEMIGIP